METGEREMEGGTEKDQNGKKVVASVHTQKI